MKEINYGLQYKVYNYNQKKCLKKPTSYSFKLKVLNFWWPKMPYSKKRKFAKDSERIMIRSIEFFKKNKKNLDMSLIGNPFFLKNNSYIQEKVITIKDYLKTHTYKQNCKIIDDYVDLLLKICKYGFMEVVFNFDRNCGVTKKGKVILFDFTEITTDLKTALNLIKSEIWLKREAYKELNLSLQGYFRKSTAKKLSKEKIRRIWGKKLK